MAAPDVKPRDPLLTWFDVELRKLSPRTTLDLHLFKPSDNIAALYQKSGQQETKYLTGWKLHALTLGYTPLLCISLHAPALTLE